LLSKTTPSTGLRSWLRSFAAPRLSKDKFCLFKGNMLAHRAYKRPITT
jgi:hypothetical protein